MGNGNSIVKQQVINEILELVKDHKKVAVTGSLGDRMMAGNSREVGDIDVMVSVRDIKRGLDRWKRVLSKYRLQEWSGTSKVRGYTVEAMLTVMVDGKGVADLMFTREPLKIIRRTPAPVLKAGK